MNSSILEQDIPNPLQDQTDRFKKKLYNQKISLAYRRFGEVDERYKPAYYDIMKEDFSKMPGHEKYGEFMDVAYKENKIRFEDVIISKDYDDFKRLYDVHELGKKPESKKKKKDGGFLNKLKRLLK